MTDTTLQPKDRLIFALDVFDIMEAERYVKMLDGSVGMFKVGLELFIKEGPKVLEVIRNNSTVEIFLDLKLHDIPATVKRAVNSAVDHNVRFLTVHCAGEEEMLTAAVSSSQQTGLEILGVSVLTSVKENAQTRATALARAEMAKRSGCAGAVCSGKEAGEIREKLGVDFKIIVPGIRSAGNTVDQDDQSRTVTPSGAIEAGADYIVVGRPIRDADDPKKAADKIVEEIKDALLNRV